MNSINLSKYGIEIKFGKDPLAVEQSNYLIKIVNVYFVYDLNAWPKNPTRNLEFKKISLNCHSKKSKRSLYFTNSFISVDFTIDNYYYLLFL